MEDGREERGCSTLLPREHVRVGVQRGFNLAMRKTFLHDLRSHACRQEETGASVAEPMDRDLRHLAAAISVANSLSPMLLIPSGSPSCRRPSARHSLATTSP